jgi:hypothetical protein
MSTLCYFAVSRPRQSTLLAGALGLFLFSQIFGKGSAIVNDSPRPTITVPQAVLIPALTAKTDDPAWLHAVTLPALTLSLGTPPLVSPPPQTKVQLLWSPDYLYVRFICQDTNIYTPIHGRDAPIYQGDAVEVFLDPVGDSRQWVELEFNADNDVFDQLFLCTTEPKPDASLCLSSAAMVRNTWNFLSWDMVGLRSQAARMLHAPNEQDWIVDIAIPAKELLRRTGLKQFAPMTLRGDFLRYKSLPSAQDKQRNLLSLNWSPVVLGRPHRSPGAYGYINLVSTPDSGGVQGAHSSPSVAP